MYGKHWDELSLASKAGLVLFAPVALLVGLGWLGGGLVFAALAARSGNYVGVTLGLALQLYFWWSLHYLNTAW